MYAALSADAGRFGVLLAKPVAVLTLLSTKESTELRTDLLTAHASWAIALRVIHNE
jgi:hypothetical protein